MQEIFRKLLGIQDSSHRIALGFGVGVSLGIFPGTGPVAAVVVALAFKLNKAAALAGSLLTNTWLSVVAFAASLRVGAGLFGLRYEDLLAQVESLKQNFAWKDLWDVLLSSIGKPLLVGYLVIGLCAGLLAYLTAWACLKKWRGQSP